MYQQSKFMRKIAEFMMGRYGIDQLFFGLWVLYVVLTLVNNWFIKSSVMSICIFAVILFAFYRCFSKKIVYRQKENAWFLKGWNPVKNWCGLQIRKIKECKTTCYHTCPACKATLRLPRRKGKHTVCCPRCRKDFTVRNYF